MICENESQRRKKNGMRNSSLSLSHTSLWQQLSKVGSIAAVDLSTWIGAPTPSNICFPVEVILLYFLLRCGFVAGRRGNFRGHFF